MNSAIVFSFRFLATYVIMIFILCWKNEIASNPTIASSFSKERQWVFTLLCSENLQHFLHGKLINEQAFQRDVNKIKYKICLASGPRRDTYFLFPYLTSWLLAPTMPAWKRDEALHNYYLLHSITVLYIEKYYSHQWEKHQPIRASEAI